MEPIRDDMGVMEAIRSRRSIRRFRPDPVPVPVIRELLEAARLAPSGGNLQPWRFAVVTDPHRRNELAGLAFEQRQMREAPAVIACCGDLARYSSQSRSARREELDLTGVYDDIGLPKSFFQDRDGQPVDLREFVPRALLNVAIAIEHIVLRATSLGLGTCWIGAFDQAGSRSCWACLQRCSPWRSCPWVSGPEPGRSAEARRRRDRPLAAPGASGKLMPETAAPGRAAPSAALRAALRRLAAYARLNLGRYLAWTAATLGYVAGFVAVPLLVGWAVAAVERGEPPAEVGRRCVLLGLAAALRRSSATSPGRSSSRGPGDRVRAPKRPLRPPPAAAAVLLRPWRTGDLMSRCVNDITSVRLLLGPGLLSLVQTR